MNRIGQLLSFILAFVLCYSQLVASTHFVEHLPQQSHSDAGRAYNHIAGHTAEHLAGHTSFHNAHHDAVSSPNHRLVHASNSSDHDDRRKDRHEVDCSIYHFYAGLNGLVQARADTPCALFNHVITRASVAFTHSQAFAYHQPIRAPPQFS